MMLRRKACCAFVAILAIFTAVHGGEVAENDVPLAGSNAEASKAWQLLKESLQDQAPLLNSLRAEEKAAKSNSNLRGMNQEANSTGTGDLDALSATSDANDALLAKLEANALEAAATAKAGGDAVDAATTGKIDTRPVNDTASAFEHEVSDLILGLGKAGEMATPMRKSIAQMKKLITTVMLDKVQEAHDNNQRALDRLSADVRSCGGVKQGQLKFAQRNEKAYRSKSPIHLKCRIAEANYATSRGACETNKKNYQTMAKITCKTFDNIKKTVANQVMNGGLVKKAAAETSEIYVRRLTSTICGNGNGGKEGSGKGGYLDRYLTHQEKCKSMTKKYNDEKKRCADLERKHRSKKTQCDVLQANMDNAACTWAIGVKDACENYMGCYSSKKSSYLTMQKVARKEETDRKAEWRGLKRMQCLIDAFSDGRVRDHEVDACKKKSHSTKHLNLSYPRLPKLTSCSIPQTYPATPAYKRAEFQALPAMARGQPMANQCSGMEEISTKPAAGSPRSCKCSRVAMMGSFSAGPLLKCTDCLDVSRSRERNSCPRGTKLFSPRSRLDWQAVLDSGGALRAPHWIVDITKATRGCQNHGCKQTMNSRSRGASAWETSDDSPWWLRSRAYSEPNGDYNANCFLNVRPFKSPDQISFNDGSCGYHSRSYYCQPKHISTTPKKGSPKTCRCTNVQLTGKYSAKALVKCEHCWDTRRSRDKNSCPKGMKIFSPASREDWKVVLASGGALRQPHWIVDVTRPSNGCGGCKNAAMKSTSAAQASWRTSDGSPWWLRSTKYSEPNGDYYANCYMDLSGVPNNENHIQFNDHNCAYHSASYYCQPAMSR